MKPESYGQQYRRKLVSADRAAALVEQGDTVCSAMAVGQPPAILEALAGRLRSRDLDRIKFYYKLSMSPIAETMLSDGVIEYVDPHCFFIAGKEHEVIQSQVASKHKLLSFVPSHFSELPKLFDNEIELDTFVATVSPMDAGGYFSFGTNNDFTSIAARRCKRLIVEVNRNMPRVFGESQLHVSEVTGIVENAVPLLEVPGAEASESGRQIGRLIEPLIPNGATIQIGIGRVPSGVTESLSQHEDLGVHTELLSPGMIDLIKNGNVNGTRKSLHRRKHVFTVAIGDRAMYDFMNDNSSFESYPASYVNDVRTISKIDDFVSVNTAIEVDLFGQVNAEFIGEHEYSGSGGHYDFVKGASLARNGVSIVALQSTAQSGTVSTIVPKVGMVTDLRMDIEYICTEHGIVNLRGKSTKERALALISIADPKFRDELTDAARRHVLI